MISSFQDFFLSRGRHWAAPGIEIDGKLADCKWQIAKPTGTGLERAGIEIAIKIMIKIKSCRFQSKAPEKTGALQKLRQFVATWRGAGPQMDGNSYVVNSSLTDSLRVESITALSSPR